jgi:hypothetical protein
MNVACYVPNDENSVHSILILGISRERYNFSFQAFANSKNRMIPITMQPTNIMKPARNPRIMSGLENQGGSLGWSLRAACFKIIIFRLPAQDQLGICPHQEI